MIHEFLQKAVQRHLSETKAFVDRLDDHLVMSEPIQNGRPLGEIFLHMIRSFEYYLRGLIKDTWEPLAYNLSTYSSAGAIKELYAEVVGEAENYIRELSSNIVTKERTDFNRTATEAEILLEMIEHSIHHRGQIAVYFRLLGTEPPIISYIV
ncbi:MAG: DinB family protein [Promethearchaeota archaeon]